MEQKLRDLISPCRYLLRPRQTDASPSATRRVGHGTAGGGPLRHRQQGPSCHRASRSPDPGRGGCTPAVGAPYKTALYRAEVGTEPYRLPVVPGCPGRGLVPSQHLEESNMTEFPTSCSGQRARRRAPPTRSRRAATRFVSSTIATSRSRRASTWTRARSRTSRSWPPHARRESRHRRAAARPWSPRRWS